MKVLSLNAVIALEASRYSFIITGFKHINALNRIYEATDILSSAKIGK